MHPVCPPSILIAEDMPEILEYFGKLFKKSGYDVVLAASGREAFEAFKVRHFDVILSDVLMDNGDGIELLKNAKALRPNTLVILLTGDISDHAQEAQQYGAHDVLLKPIYGSKLLDRIRCALSEHANAQPSVDDEISI